MNESNIEHPINLPSLEKAFKDRLEVIVNEFTRAFDTIKKYPRSVTFFGSARLTEENKYYQQAKDLAGKIVKDLNYSIVTGGGSGIMKAANQGAKEAGGQSIGFQINIGQELGGEDYTTDKQLFHYFFARKVALSFAAETYIFFPGGFGTLDELFEILTLVQTKKIAPVPIILFGVDFWEPLDMVIKSTLYDAGTIDKNDIALYTITNDEEKILDIIRSAPVRVMP